MNIFVQVQSSEQTLFNFLILGKSRFPQKKFYNINSREKCHFTLFFLLWSLPKMFRLILAYSLFVSLSLGVAFAADCISSNGVKCLKKSDMPSGFGPLMAGGDPCFVNSGNRVRNSLNFSPACMFHQWHFCVTLKIRFLHLFNCITAMQLLENVILAEKNYNNLV